MPDDKLFLTALPNGTLGNAFRLSLFLTPSLADNGSLHPPFDSWPDTARNLSWTVGFYTTAHAPIGNPIGANRDPDSPADFDTDLWAQVFAGVRVKRRQSHRHLNHTWRLSHNISKLHQRHLLLRMARAYEQVAEANITSMPPPKSSRCWTALPCRAFFLHPKFPPKQRRAAVRRADGRAHTVDQPGQHASARSLQRHGGPPCGPRDKTAGKLRRSAALGGCAKRPLPGGLSIGGAGEPVEPGRRRRRCRYRSHPVLVSCPSGLASLFPRQLPATSIPCSITFSCCCFTIANSRRPNARSIRPIFTNSWGWSTSTRQS